MEDGWKWKEWIERRRVKHEEERDEVVKMFGLRTEEKKKKKRNLSVQTLVESLLSLFHPVSPALLLLNMSLPLKRKKLISTLCFPRTI